MYAAGQLVLEGHPAAPFDPAQQHARERAIFGEATPFYGWHYPPFFLLVAAALALMPYPLALALWQAVTLLLYLLSIRAIAHAATQPATSAREAPLPATAVTDWTWLLLALRLAARTPSRVALLRTV